MKTATSLTFVAVGAIIAFAITAHPSFLNLHMVGAVLILTGAAGAIIPRLRRTRAVSSTGTAAAGRPARRPQPSPGPAPRRQPAASPDARPAERETTETIETTKEYASA